MKTKTLMWIWNFRRLLWGLTYRERSASWAGWKAYYKPNLGATWHTLGDAVKKKEWQPEKCNRRDILLGRCVPARQNLWRRPPVWSSLKIFWKVTPKQSSAKKSSPCGYFRRGFLLFDLRSKVVPDYFLLQFSPNWLDYLSYTFLFSRKRETFFLYSGKEIH